MFGFLKDKLKSAISSFSKKAEELPEIKEETPASAVIEEQKEQAKAQETKEPVEIPEHEENFFIGQKKEPVEAMQEKKQEEKKGFFGRIRDKFKKPDESKITIKQSRPEEKKGFLDKIKEVASTTKISDKEFDEMFYDFEIALLESNVAYSVVEKIKSDLKKDIANKPVKRSDIDDMVEKSLKKSILSLFDVESFSLVEKIKGKKEKPFTMVFVGVNGVGKTSTIAKIANYLKKNNLSCVLAAGDTWRAASIEQLEHHANKLGIKIIKHNYGSDPTAVAYDAVSYAKSNHMDAVLIDTAGRQHSNVNLISEMQKIIRVIKPDLKIFIGESITGSDCIEQASSFDNAIGIDGIILSKADIDDKGGAAISIEYIVKKPIIYIGMGQDYDDLKEFNKDNVLASIGL
ncbi:signal recognition particle-docking protein FtsY [Candidatus Woesearchaeota archaeon]|nr:signal recognition particle-docking protein FtsY [Candidatus Woesearchaeota archaeon]